MRPQGESIILSATDLANHLGCRHLTAFDLQTARGTLTPPKFKDPLLELLKERGRKFEDAYTDALRARGLSIADCRNHDREQVAAEMRKGTHVLVQAKLGADGFIGIADFLMRVEHPSHLGAWSYEVVDTKLARNTRGGTLLQLCLYSTLVRAIQGHMPAHMHVVKPGPGGFETESFRADDFLAYFRFVRQRLVDAIHPDAPAPDGYPLPVPQCDICRWWKHCVDKRRADDHLCLVAGLQTAHVLELEEQGFTSLEDYATADEPLRSSPPTRGHRATYERLHAQAAVQLRGRREQRPVSERIGLEDGRGLYRLPAPSPGDVFFDIEGARFVDDGGLEYLFGWCVPDPAAAGELVYRGLWCTDRAAERRGFETFIDTVMERWARDPGMHVYHYHHYEPSAMKRLMGRYGTREAEVDRLLRGERFVDLHAVARQAVRCSVERYSLKDLEPHFGYTRAVDLRDASLARFQLEAALELGDPASIDPDDRATVEGYNREDCEATAALRTWLEGHRAAWVGHGEDIPRPEPKDGEPGEKTAERRAAVAAVYDALVDGLPDDRADRDAEQQARWLLANLLDYHRRELNSAWWEFFRLQELELEATFDERKALGGLELVEEVEAGRCPIHRYSYPEQELALDAGDQLHEVGGERVGTVQHLDTAARTIDIKKAAVAAALHPAAVFVREIIKPHPKDQALLELGRQVAAHGIDADGPFRAARDLLLRHPPRRGAVGADPLLQDGESVVDAGVRIAGELDGGLLAIQGPPGTGKTYTGARMILSLLQQGKRVGVTAVSHRVIRNLLEKVLELGRAAGRLHFATHKIGSDTIPGHAVETDDTDEALAALDSGHVVGGTAWLWARDDAQGTLDHLFVDEAGQMAMADVLAVGRAARNIVLIGDPEQLEQPQQGSHPDGTDVAALTHLLGDETTIPAHLGLFLETTRRLHPTICRFTSDQFYAGRLRSLPGLEHQALHGQTPFAGAGLLYVPVRHDGHQSCAPPEVEAVARIVEGLLGGAVTWTDDHEACHPLTAADIMIVAPYNAQIAALRRRLPDLKIGTVDKFQGQQAPVVLYSMTTSTPEDAPRGMEFLYNPNRLNVATSRARCACILVAEPRLFEPSCRTPDQMRQANGLCRYREMARTVELTGS